MNSGICACVLLAVLSSTCLARPSAGSEGDGSPTAAQLDQSASVLNRNVRSAPNNAQLRPFLKTDGTAQQRAGIGSLLSKYIKQMMKGPSGMVSASGKSHSIEPNHRINDRDYVGWMDFGRRSAEEYEYSS
ncbi:cholecystokinin-like [Erpetoichthys calabaricus]|uniref:Cholecystokinin a n=1 Tax=Erpetoichthys calabaricus TaxID=27687 RepID=A0A8C4T8K0_ERPCA|nr:cholecystokinin-like [Erpetoichthys calabaricus]